jgi:hypothetical protein
VVKASDSRGEAWLSVFSDQAEKSFGTQQMSLQLLDLRYSTCIVHYN